jgi:CheY-like chemotaxis protein
MLGLTSYQEALRAIGRLVGQLTDLKLAEDSEAGRLELTTSGTTRVITPADLEQIVLSSLAHRGEHRPAGETSDLLRAVGLALDELHASQVAVVLRPDHLTVRFVDQQKRPRELSYAGEELLALCRSAAARRNGQPLRRILILQAGPETATPLIEPLVAEFAIQALPTAYARAVAAVEEPPDLVLAQLVPSTLQAVQWLRRGPKTATVPIVLLAGAESQTDAVPLLQAGADDLLQEPVLPALLRARVRTWLLRRRDSPPKDAQ